MMSCSEGARVGTFVHEQRECVSFASVFLASVHSATQIPRQNLPILPICLA